MIGSVLNGYRIASLLREGLQGPIFRATGPDGQAVAVKVLSEAASARPDKRKPFLHGAQVARSLTHPNILRVLDVGDAKSFPYCVMELFESENLKYVMWNRREWIGGNEYYLLRQIAGAVRHCHDQKIIHGDVKPENILVNAHAAVRLHEFSTARRRAKKLLKVFASRQRSGSPLYMSPEQIRGNRTDALSDVYSFGVLAYEVITRHPPFLGTSPDSIFKKHLKEDPPPMSRFLEHPDEGLEDLVRSLLAKKPKERPDDWTKIVFELTKWERKATQIRKISTTRRKETGSPQA